MLRVTYKTVRINWRRVFKQYLCSLAFMTFGFLLPAQYQTPLSHFGNSGGFGQVTLGGSTSFVEWTFGEVIIGKGDFQNQKVTMGEQQALSTSPLSLSNHSFQNLKVYPNPAISQLHLRNLPADGSSITLADVSARVALSLPAGSSAVDIPISGLSSGLYVLTVVDQQSHRFTYKISINNN